ncbi:HPF/RaiA family ribosome-associated protein [Pseudomonas weihenstephanensis]|jgi:ribosome-associated translation inhibitor RaiA|uniref:HPF/RaiA family ribosome-associated protein n=1 Tax=Pseudomonas weihenstephanensis TaxID=1608994 RepID=A0ABS1ZN24_9PSED|nr:HPF/RaiA family ribosome-associated protein [Pseudomonas weihenstephanensis]MBM1197838.1 HPF/RaiA family ribosome-associated protein [Pseudomonas weihenstephanensis]
MQIQVHCDKHIKNDVRLEEWVDTTVKDRLDLFEEDITRVDVFLSDENGGKSGPNDKRCKMEARPKGHQPLIVTEDADSVDRAVEGAAEKLQHALEHLFGKLRNKPSAKLPAEGFGEEELKESADDLLEEEFLEKEKELDKIS